jgi:hypothetical protein
MKTVRRIVVLGLLVIYFAGLESESVQALVIIPSWDDSITNDPNAATIESTINTAIQYYEARFSDPITVTMTFQETTNGLSHNTFWYWSISYSNYIAALQSDATTTNDLIALAHLPTAIDPVTGFTTIRVKTATLHAAGFTGMNSGLAGGVDGIIKLNVSRMNLSRSSTNPNKYDLMVCAEHEMDEVLGLGSALNSDDTHSLPEDLFRYDSSGNRSFTTNGDDAYFSIDGTNLLARFNQNPNLDYGDWWTSGPHTAQVQDAEIAAGATPDLGVELIALDVIGYDLLPPPQPGITGINISGTNLTLNCTNGLASGTYYLLTSTNLALPLSQWTSIATNMLNANGNFSIVASNVVNLNSQQQFYTIQLRAAF